ncbi:eCIS core domain-containing protein [Leptolyngbya ohadii]|uniref:eCIS core domain-containing protein n=1 Tax=Leptolyngbya ohadii TaxID=1962290 RepID=UPI000B5A2018|nr:DUF4157 domain-containing protein [Leptolyngbya ohadii]
MGDKAAAQTPAQTSTGLPRSGERSLLQRQAINSEAIEKVPPIVHEVLRFSESPTADFSRIPVTSKALSKRAPAPLPGGMKPRPLPSISFTAPSAPSSVKPAPVPAIVERTVPSLVPIYRLAMAESASVSGDQSTHSIRSSLAAVRGMSALGSGVPLPKPVQSRLESSYGYCLDPVRLHRDPIAAQVAEAFQAQAVTLGDHILLGREMGQSSSDFVLGHEVAHVVQGRLHPRSRLGRPSQPTDAVEIEANAAALATMRGETIQLHEGASDDPQLLAWWILALIGLGVGAAVAGVAASTGHSTEENRRRQVREQRSTGENVLAWVPIAGSVQDIWQAESNLQLALGVGFLAFDVATLGGTGMLVRALIRVPRASLRVLARGAERAAVEQGTERTVMRVAGEEVTEEALQQAVRQSSERGMTVSAATATEEISRALSQQGAMVFAMEGGHAVMYANRAGQILKVHGGPLIVRLTADMTEQGAAAVARGAVEGASREGAVTAYAIVQQGAPLTLEALERMPAGLRGVAEAVSRLLFGNPTSCGVVQGAAIEASGLTAEAIARLIPRGGASGQYIPITLVDHWLQTGAGRLVEGGVAKLVYGAATSTVTQFTLGILPVFLRPAIPVVSRQGAMSAASPGPSPQPTATTARPPHSSSATRSSTSMDAGTSSRTPSQPSTTTPGTPLPDPIAQQMERTAVEIITRWGTRPSTAQVTEIRAALPDLVPGWFVLNSAAVDQLRAALRQGGMDAATIAMITN